MILGIFALAIFIGLLLNHRYKVEREWDDSIREIRRERCGRHDWAKHAETGKLACINCEFAP